MHHDHHHHHYPSSARTSCIPKQHRGDVKINLNLPGFSSDLEFGIRGKEGKVSSINGDEQDLKNLTSLPRRLTASISTDICQVWDRFFY